MNNAIKNSWSHRGVVKVIMGGFNGLKEIAVNPKNILLVTSKSFVKRGLVEEVAAVFPGSNIRVAGDISSNPEVQELNLQLRKWRSVPIEVVIGVGGGSVMDSAKFLAVGLKSQEKMGVMELLGVQNHNHDLKRLPLALAPTTAGTGSEVTSFATVWDSRIGKKYSLSGDHCFADLALLNSDLLATLKKDQWLYSGLDAISHALESLWNKNQNPLSKIYAINALQSIIGPLSSILSGKSSSEQQGDQIMFGAMLSGLAINETKTAIAHSISYPLTLKHNVPHGLAASFTLSEILRKNFTYLSDDGVPKGILSDAQNFLDSLNLGKRLLNYLSAIEVISLIPEMNHVERMGNYLRPISELQLEELLVNSIGNKDIL
jgi:phosphonate metabolism-associated iron-containing alcohol dehydrogenase